MTKIDSWTGDSIQPHPNSTSSPHPNPRFLFCFYFYFDFLFKFQFVQQLMMNLELKAYLTRYQVPFQLQRIELALKHRKLPQYFVTNCRYDQERAYKPINTNQQKKHKHARKIIWGSTPFRKSVSTKVRKPFLSLLVLHYPKNYTFSKNYNRDNTQSKQD